MARTRFFLRLFSKNFDIWLQRWSQIPKYKKSDLLNYIRKLLIYYPKDPQLLKLLTLEINNGKIYNEEEQGIKAENVPEIRQLYKRITTRYKRELLSYQDIDISQSKPDVWSIWRAASFLKLSQTENMKPGVNSLVKKTIKGNKRLKVIQLENDLSCSEEIISHFRYIKSLESVYIRNIPFILQSVLERIFASNMKLKNITLTGKLGTSSNTGIDSDLDSDSDSDINSNTHAELGQQTACGTSQLIKIILQLPNLKRFNFDVDTSNQLDLNKIPFNVLKKRNLSYDIRFVNASQDKLALSAATESGLESLEFLGINTIPSWLYSEPLWNAFQEGQLKAQEACKKVLFISVFNMVKPDLSHLLMACRKISTLHLSLSMKSPMEGMSFSSLKYLENLQNLYLVLDNIRGHPYIILPEDLDMDLFNNLSFCAKRLRTVSIHLTGQIRHKNDSKILQFFRACSKTLTFLTLLFSCHEITPPDTPKIFYEGIVLLEKLESLKLIYDQVAYDFDPEISQFKKLGQCGNLRELCISMPPWQGVGQVLPSLKNLERLQLEIYKSDKKIKILEQMSCLMNLRHLEISSLEIDKKSWTSFLKTVSKLKLLETLKIKHDLYAINEADAKNLLEDLKVLKENHPSLISIACGGNYVNCDTVWFFGKSSSSWKEDGGSFLWRNEKGLPKRRISKVYCL